MNIAAEHSLLRRFLVEGKMYEPIHHREEDRETLNALIRAHPLGLLACNGPDGPVANAIPFLLDAEAGPHGRLQAHMARANPQWKLLADTPDTPVVIIFQGAEHYITPSWYALKRETGKVVPTWNYVMVQVRGRVRVIEDRDWLADQIARLTDTHEGDRAEPWAVGDAPDEFVAMQMRAIVGIEIDIETISGKWKVSQNRSAADRDGVATGLDAERSSSAAEMLREVRRFID